MWSGLARFIDYSIVSLIAMARPRYLRDEPGPPTERFLTKLLRWEGATTDLVRVEESRRESLYRVTVRGNGRTCDTILYYKRAPEPTRRLIVSHHGLGERPPTRTYRALVGEDYASLPADRILLVAPGHIPGRGGLSELLSRIGGFEEMLACSVVAAKAVIEQFGDRYDRTALTGMSLGGIVALTETLYRPMYSANVSVVGTPFMASVLLRSALARMVDDRFRLRCGYEALRQAVDMDDHVGLGGRRIVMINGRSDAMVDIDLLRPWWRSRPDIEAHEVAESHLSMLVRSGPLRRLVMEILRRELGIPAQMDGPSGRP